MRTIKLVYVGFLLLFMLSLGCNDQKGYMVEATLRLPEEYTRPEMISAVRKALENKNANFSEIRIGTADIANETHKFYMVLWIEDDVESLEAALDDLVLDLGNKRIEFDEILFELKREKPEPIDFW